MRVLFTCAAADGHFLPLLPLARAFRDRGADVAFATAGSFGRVTEAGFAHLPAGIDQRELDSRYASHRAEIFTLPIPDRREQAFSRRFALLDSPARVDDLRAQVSAWMPDVLVHESAELAAPLVAALHGLPSVHQSFGRAIPRVAIDRAAAIVAPLWELAGLAPDPDAGMFRGTYVDIAPPSLASEPPPAGTRVIPLRPIERSAPVPTPRPLVYVTLGTVFTNVASYRLLLAALAGLDADVLVTTGLQNDPAELGPLPANTTAERYVPQADVLPRAALVVTHGGSGSMIGALAHGVPMVVVPQQADQFDNATAATTAGAARTLLPDAMTEEAVRDAARAVLEDPRYRDAAEAIAAEIAAMPSPEEVAGRLEAELTRG